MAHIVKHTYQLKRGTAERWQELNIVLNPGEPGFEIDTGQLKIGDGTTPWSELPYVGDGNSGTSNNDHHFIYEIIVSNGANHLEAIETYFNGIIPHKNDIVIIKENIYNNEQFTHTAYSYDGTRWIAFDGNYNANNVYFDTDFIFTKPIGVINIPASGSIIVDAAGKNIQQFFAELFAEEEYPTLPEVKVFLTSNNIGAKEVGTNVAVQFAFNPNVGKYLYGPDTNVKWDNYSATFNLQTKNTPSGTFDMVQVTDDMSLTITGSCTNSDGAIPKTNLGNDYPEAQIKAKNWTDLKKGTLTGYRAWFCGYKNGNNALTTPTKITGEQIRALGYSANGSWESQMNVSQMQQMYFAAPAGKGYKPIIKDASTTAPQTVLGPFQVDVPGANGYTPITYDVWYVANAQPATGNATLNITKN